MDGLGRRLVRSARGPSGSGLRALLLAGATVASLAVAVAAIHVRGSAPGPDIGRWLQRRVDRGGGLVFLSRLVGGRCYRSRGLWVSRSDTTVASNGACLMITGPGPVRLYSCDGDAIAASAAFFVSRGSPSAAPPEHVTIRGLRIRLPPGVIDGIDVYARYVRIRDVRIEGSPFDDVYIGGRTNLIGASREVTLTGSTLLDAERNAVSITAAVGVRIGDDTIAGAGVGTGAAADPGNGIDIEPNTPDDPIVDIQIAHNRIVGNAHEGIALRLRRDGALSSRADSIVIVANMILGNSPYGGGPQLSFGDGQASRVLVAGNVFPPDASGRTTRASRASHGV